MKIIEDVKLDFSDVLILPKKNNYSSRSEVSLERAFTFKYSSYSWSGVPIMVSNMDTTGTVEMAAEMQKHKVLTCLHKYYKPCDLLTAELNNEYFAISTGINQNDLDNLDNIIKSINIKFICVDVANGYMNKLVETCLKIREMYPDKIIIAGNVCTAEGVLELVLHGKVDIVKVGIGSGSCCTTRKQTGIGMPQLSAVIECSDVAHRLGAHIISDGGLQVVGDFSKAYGAGSDFVMSGSMFAGHNESGGETIEENGKKYKVFYGMSSTTAMNTYSGGVAKYRTSEGKTVKIEHRGPVEKTILDIQGGIRSTITYIGAKGITDMPECVTFIKVHHQLNTIYNGKEI
jgi:GMP reductase